MVKSNKLERYTKEISETYYLDEGNKSPIIADITISDISLNEENQFLSNLNYGGILS